MVRRLVSVALLVSVAGVGFACGSSKQSAPATVTNYGGGSTEKLPSLAPGVTVPKNAAKNPFTENEKAYLKKLHGWLVSVGGASDRLAFAADGPPRAKLLKGKIDPRLRPGLAILRTCRKRLQAIGEPPTKRLEAGAKALRSSCDHLAEAARAVQKSLATQDPAGLVIFDGELDKAAGAYGVAELALMPQESRDLPVTAKPGSGSRVDTRFGNATQSWFQTGVEVRCWSKSDWPKIVDESQAFAVEPGIPPDALLGFVLGGNRANLSPDTCKALDDLVYRKQRPRGGNEQLRLATGLVVLTHETEHVAGVSNEAEAECYAMQDAPDTGIALGLPKDYAVELGTLYWEKAYPRDLAEYRSPECRNNGKLDLFTDNRWP